MQRLSASGNGTTPVMKDRMRSIALMAMMVLLRAPAALGQTNPIQGPITLTAAENVVETTRPHMGLILATVGKYSCSNLRFAAPFHLSGDSILITIGDIESPGMCDEAFGPGYGYVHLALDPGSYTVAITRGQITDRGRLRVTKDRLMIQQLGELMFIQPDTVPLLRARARSFLVTCGAPSASDLCADIRQWIARQPGIYRVKISDSTKIAFPRYGGYGHADYDLFTYGDDEALRPLVRCMRFLSDTLTLAVGVGVTLQTANGSIYRAWSMRSYDQHHIAIPSKISGSKECPAR
jgi:hypothetical protein